MFRTIRSARDIDTLFRTGDRRANSHAVVFVNPTSEPGKNQGRVAVIAGRLLGNAVLRNRIRRLLREMVRALGGPWPGYDVLIVARKALLRSELGEAQREIGRLLRDLEVPK